MDLSYLIGFVLPPVIDLVNRYIDNSQVRYLVAMLICLVVGALFHYQELLDGDWSMLLAKASIVFAEAQTIYRLYWKDSGARKQLTSM